MFSLNAALYFTYLIYASSLVISIEEKRYTSQK